MGSTRPICESVKTISGQYQNNVLICLRDHNRLIHLKRHWRSEESVGNWLAVTREKHWQTTSVVTKTQYSLFSLFISVNMSILACCPIRISIFMYITGISWFVTFVIFFKQHFDTRYLVFYNTSPPRMFLSLDLLWEYRIQHGANGPLYVTSSYSTWIFCRGVSGFATDCPCGVWCRGLTTCLLHVGPPFGNRILNNSWAVGLT